MNSPYLPGYMNALGQNSFAPQMEIQKVSGGEDSVKAYPMGPNSSVILLDSINPLIWVVTTDASAYKTITPFTITPYIPEQPVTAADLKDVLNSVIARLDKIEERMNSNVQSNNGPAWKNESGNARTQSNDRNGQSFAKSAGGINTNVAK